jgi:hypothetical protein
MNIKNITAFYHYMWPSLFETILCYLKQADVLLRCVTLIYKLRTVDETEHYTCWSWSKTDVSDKDLISRTAVVVHSVTGKPFAENEDAVSSTMGC